MNGPWKARNNLGLYGQLFFCREPVWTYGTSYKPGGISGDNWRICFFNFADAEKDPFETMRPYMHTVKSGQINNLNVLYTGSHSRT